MLKKPAFFFLLVLTGGSFSYGQAPPFLISTSSVAAVEKALADDSMQGRRTFSPGNEKAADFIAGQFSQAGLQPLPGLTSFRQPFEMISAVPVQVSVLIDGKQIGENRILSSSSQPALHWKDGRGTKVVGVGKDVDFFSAIRPYLMPRENTLVLVDEKWVASFGRLEDYLKDRVLFPAEASVVFVLGASSASRFSVDITNRVTVRRAANIVGMLPGKSRPGEYVIFSAHYDHLGTDPRKKGDSIYNGANDDASGSTAVIELAKYYKASGSRARSLIFVTFTGEEEGGYGSQYFSRQLDPDSVMAMFNIEMIGTPSRWGGNAAYITGYDKSDFGKILQEDLRGSGFVFHPDPYPEENLFYRSDNATLACLGVPAHTISTAKMDREKHYHQVDDEVGTLDLDNMAAIIRAIAVSAQRIINAEATPSRVSKENVRE